MVAYWPKIGNGCVSSLKSAASYRKAYVLTCSSFVLTAVCPVVWRFEIRKNTGARRPLLPAASSAGAHAFAGALKLAAVATAPDVEGFKIIFCCDPFVFLFSVADAVLEGAAQRWKGSQNLEYGARSSSSPHRRLAFGPADRLQSGGEVFQWCLVTPVDVHVIVS